MFLFLPSSIINALFHVSCTTFNFAYSILQFSASLRYGLFVIIPASSITKLRSRGMYFASPERPVM